MSSVQLGKQQGPKRAPIVIYDHGPVRLNCRRELSAVAVSVRAPSSPPQVKPTPLKPKNELTMEELSLPTAFQALPEIKPSIQYWLNGGTVKYEERGWSPAGEHWGQPASRRSKGARGRHLDL